MHRLSLLLGVGLLCLSFALAEQSDTPDPSEYSAVSGQSLLVRPDGGLIVAGLVRAPAGTHQYSSGFEDVFVAWVSADGEVEHGIRLVSEAMDRLGNVSLDADGNVYVAGSTTGTLPGAVGAGTQFIAKLSGDAELLWVRQQYGGRSIYPYPAVLTLGPDGEILVAGAIRNGNGNNNVFRYAGFNPYYDGYLQVLDENGQELSISTFSMNNTQFPTDIVALDNGDAMIVGIQAPDVLTDPTGIRAFGFAARVDSSTGAVLSSFPLSREGNSVVQYSIDVLDDDTFALAFSTHGNSVGELDYDQYELRLRSADGVVGLWHSNGEMAWAKDFGNTNSYSSKDVVLLDDFVVVTGSGNGNLGGDNYGKRDGFILAYSTDGQRLWADNIGTANIDQVEDMALATDGTLYLTGFTNGHDADRGLNLIFGGAWFLAAYNSDGKQLWFRQYTADDFNW